MGVYIKGMEMPTTGVYILSIDNTGKDKTIFTIAEHTNSGKIIPCHVGEAVSLPPHGRLGDLDYLKLTFCSECTLYPDKCLEKTADGCDWHSIAHLEMCPTIIEAEGEE